MAAAADKKLVDAHSILLLDSASSASLDTFQRSPSQSGMGTGGAGRKDVQHRYSMPPLSSQQHQNLDISELGISGHNINLEGMDGNNLSLKHQEALIQQLKKDNFSLKLRVYYLEERLTNAYSSVEGGDFGTGLTGGPKTGLELAKENVELKVQLDKVKQELDHFQSQTHQTPSNVLAEREKWDRERREMREEITSLRTRLNQQLEEQTRDSSTLTASLESRLVSYREEVESLHQQLNETKQSLLERNSILAQRAIEMEQAKARIEELESLLDEATAENEQLKAHNSDLSQALKSLEQQRKTLQQNAQQQQQRASSRLSHSRSHELLGQDPPMRLQDLSLEEAGNKSFESVGGTTIHHHHYGSSTPPPVVQQQQPLFQASPVGNQQLEQGIALLRDQISELKLQLINKTSRTQELMLELDSKNQTHQRAMEELKSQFTREEVRLQGTMGELKQQLALKAMDLNQAMQKLESVQQQYSSEHTQNAVQIHTLQQQISNAQNQVSSLKLDLDRAQRDLKESELDRQRIEEREQRLKRELDTVKRDRHEVDADTAKRLDTAQKRLSELTQDLQLSRADSEAKSVQIRSLQDQIDRQRRELVELEQQLVRQTHDLGSQHKSIRGELETQIAQFQLRVTELSTELAKKTGECREMEKQLEMHSVGLEERLRASKEEKDRLKDDIEKFLAYSEDLKAEAESWHRKYEQAEAQTKHRDDELQEQHRQMQDLSQQVGDLTNELAQARQQTRIKEAQIRDLERKAAEVQASAEAVSSRTNTLDRERRETESKLEECLVVLKKVDDLASRVLNVPVSLLGTSSPSGEVVVEKVRSALESSAAMTRTKINAVEKRMESELRALSSKLDYKLEQLSKFEVMVRDAANVQQRLKQQLKQRQEDLLRVQHDLTKAQHEISVREHAVESLKSQLMLDSSSDRVRLMEAQGKIVELERLIKDRERQLQQKPSSASHQQQQQSLSESHLRKAMTELQDRHSRLKRELDEKSYLLTQLRREQQSAASSTSTQHQVSQASQQLWKSTESALTQLNQQLQREINDWKAQLEQDHNRTRHLEDQLSKARLAHDAMLKRLERRENVIQLALGKLEMVSQRRDSMQQVLQVTGEVASDVRRALRGSMHSLNNPSQQQQ